MSTTTEPAVHTAIALLTQFLNYARDERNTWESRDGDEADYKFAEWTRKVYEIQDAIRALEKP